MDYDASANPIQSLLYHQTLFMQFFSMFSKDVDKMAFMNALQSLLVSLKTIIMTDKRVYVQKQTFVILTALYMLIPYTRDIYGGMGERDLTYMMLFIWNYHFPLPTAQCLLKIVLPLEENPPYGSWRDIKYLCAFVRKYSEKGESDPFIDTCIGMMNHQLDTDMKGWTIALDEFIRHQEKVMSVGMARPTPSSVGCSLVSKWIPREHSSFDWLFKRAAVQWIKSFSPHYFKSCKTEGQFQKALKKGSKEYRHVFARLSKEWGTLEIKQCMRQWDSISFSEIPMMAASRQQQSLLNIGLSGKARASTMHDAERNMCAQKSILHRMGNDRIKKKYPERVNPIFMDMGLFIQNALRVKHEEETRRIENQWTHMLAQITEMPYFLPIVDMGMFYRSPKRFYEALGHACLVAMKSSKSILLFDETIHYVSLDSCRGSILKILNMLKPIYYEHHIGKNVDGLLERLVKSIVDSEIDTTNLRWVFFVDVVYSDIEHIRLKLLHHLQKNHMESCPRLLFWLGGTSKSCICDGETVDQSLGFDETIYASFGNLQPGLILSGSHNHLWTHISQIPSEVLQNIHPFQLVKRLLGHSRYQPFESYFATLLSR
jgi:hypothetical protein